MSEEPEGFRKPDSALKDVPKDLDLHEYAGMFLQRLGQRLQRTERRRIVLGVLMVLFSLSGVVLLLQYGDIKPSIDRSVLVNGVPVADLKTMVSGYASELRILPEGEVLVNEGIPVQVGAESPMRGIVRYFPSVYADAINQPLPLAFEVKAVYRDAAPEIFQPIPSDQIFALKIGDPTAEPLSYGAHAYNLELIVRGAIRVQGEMEQLVWTVFGPWNIEVPALSVYVRFPKLLESKLIQLRLTEAELVLPKDEQEAAQITSLLEMFKNEVELQSEHYSSEYLAPDAEAQSEEDKDVVRLTLEIKKPLPAMHVYRLYASWPKGFIKRPGTLVEASEAAAAANAAANATPVADSIEEAFLGKIK